MAAPTTVPTPIYGRRLMTDVIAQTPDAVRESAALLFDVLVDRLLNADQTPAEEWVVLAEQADVAARQLRVPPTECPRCRGRELKEPTHGATCPVLNPPTPDRDAQIAELEAKIEPIAEEFQSIIRAAETARIDALFACNCPKPEPKRTARGGPAATFGERVRQATDKMAAKVLQVAGNPDVLRVAFASGAVKTWDLPPKTDHAGIKAITDGGITWAKENGATPGQAAAVRKALTDTGYYARAQ
jgi:hypothetical protein